MQIVYRHVSDLIPYVNNARKNDHAVDAVASSIKNYGFKQPIVIDSQGEVIAGHTRLKAAKKLNMEQVPCIIADDLTPAQIKAYRIADNKVAELSEWDMELLKVELEDIEGFTGFDADCWCVEIELIGRIWPCPLIPKATIFIPLFVVCLVIFPSFIIFIKPVP